MHLLDTDALTHLMAGHRSIRDRLDRLGDAEVGTTVVTKIEMLRGRFDFLVKAVSGGDVLRRRNGWLAPKQCSPT